MRIATFFVVAALGWAQYTPPGGGGGGSGTVTSVGLAGTANQITVTGASPITGTGSWTLSFPAGGVTLPGTTTGTFSGNITGAVTGNASTATALAANPTNCSAGNYPLGIDASGNAENCTAASGGTPGTPVNSVQFNNPLGTFAGSYEITADVTTANFVNLSNGFAPLTLRGTYTGTGATDVLSGVNQEIFVTPNANTQGVQGFASATATLGSSDFDALVGSNFSAYAQGNGTTNRVAAYIADAEVQGGNAGELADFYSYGIYSTTGTTVGSAFHYWAGGGGIAGTITNLYTYFGASPTVTGTVTNDFGMWLGALGGTATLSYPLWVDEQGVFRIRADNTFDSVYQAIPALYNPQITKYTPGAANYERVVMGQWNGNVAEIGTEKGGTGTLRDLRLIGANIQAAVPLKLNGDVVNPFQQAKNSQSATAPGAGFCDLRWIAGTNSGTGKLVAACGTSATEVTIVDNVGAAF